MVLALLGNQAATLVSEFTTSVYRNLCIFIMQALLFVKRFQFKSKCRAPSPLAGCLVLSTTGLLWQDDIFCLTNHLADNWVLVWPTQLSIHNVCRHYTNLVVPVAIKSADNDGELLPIEFVLKVLFLYIGCYLKLTLDTVISEANLTSHSMQWASWLRINLLSQELGFWVVLFLIWSGIGFRLYRRWYGDLFMVFWLDLLLILPWLASYFVC